jgi:hypothetical protein
MGRKSFVFVVMGTLILFLASISSADVPHMITYSGKVTKPQGGLINGTFQMSFSIYPDTLGSSADWTETQAEVEVKHSIFSVLLGSVNPIDPSVFDGSVKYLGIQIESDPELLPLRPIVSVAYAYRAGDADVNCGWVDDGTVVRLETDTDNVGIGTASPAYKLDVVGGDIRTNVNMYANAFIADNNHNYFLAPTYSTSISVLGDIITHGDVGIGTDGPAAKLHVVGGGFLLNTDEIGGYYCRIDGNEISGGVAGGPPGSHDLHIKPGDNSSYLLLAEDGGNVGIGTASPTSELEIYGDEDDLVGIRITNPNTGSESSEGIYFLNEDGDVAFIRLYDDDNASYPSQMRISNNRPDGDIVLGTSNGAVGIGTAPAYELDVAGQAHASSFPVSSDARLKKNVKQLTNVLEKLEQIRGVSFDWNELYESLGRSTGHREIGVIAQEVETVFPELVTTWSDEEYRAVDYSRLTAVLVEAIKELKAENEALKQRIDALEDKGMSLPMGR